MALVQDPHRLWSRWVAWSCHSPGALICHPIALASLILLIANDHVLKGLVPGMVTGKLSDVAGLVYFPLLVVAGLDIVRQKPSTAARRDTVAAMACLLTAIAFASIKTIPQATELFNRALGLTQWAIGGGALAGAPVAPTQGLTDPSDLIALPALFVAFGIARRQGLRAGNPQPRRLSALSLATIFVAGLASIATSPAMRSSSTDYEEPLQLTRDAPAVTRHLTVDVTNRDAKLDSIDLIARTYSVGADRVQFKTPGVLLTLVPDDVRGSVTQSSDYFAPALSLFDACESSCHEGVTAVVRLADPETAAAGPIPTHLEITLAAVASEEGTGPVDIDLGLVNDADRAFQGAPATLVVRETGSFHIGSDVAAYSQRFKITIEGEALGEPYGFPLVGRIQVGATHETSLGHPNAHDTAFAFHSPSLPEDAYRYGFYDYARIWYEEPPFEDPTVLDLLPLCEPGMTCVINAMLTSTYDESLNDPPPSGATPPLRSIDLDWYLEVRLEAYDGRELPEGTITIEPAD